MNLLDVLYTPLDCPDTPKTNIPKLLDWIDQLRKEQEISNRADASRLPHLAKNYPWNIIYARHNKAWFRDFDKEFPELADFFSSAYGLKESDINSIVLLPVKSEFAGLGFWHSDPDPNSYGLRLYIENQESDNDFLYIRPSVEPYITRPEYGLHPSFNNTPLQDVTHTAKLYNPTQAFYLNNVRAIHAINTKQAGVLRIASIITSLDVNLQQHINDLVVKSAKKFKDYAIYWTPEYK
jgi:hypothetical protein